MTIESLEPRWTPTWGGVPPATVSLPSAPVGVTLSSANDATGSAEISTSEVDYYAFTPTTSGTYTISTSTPSSSLDTVVGLFSSSGQRLAYNDDTSWFNTDSFLVVNLTAGTKYYLGVTNYSTLTRGAYNWTVDGPAAAVADDAYENNDTLATASNLGTISSSTTVSSLVMADSADWYKFSTTGTAASTAAVSISFLHAQGDLDLEVYNSAGTLVGRSQGTGNSESVSLSGLAAGTYYVRVYGYRGVFNPNYSLTINGTTTTSVTTPPTTTNPTSPVTAFPDVPYYGTSTDWALNSINAPEAWSQGYRGDGVVVAVIDTGVDLSHPELTSNIWVNPGEIAGNGIDDDHDGYVDDVHGWDFASNDNSPNDQNGHGTHVAGIIAAAANGTGSTGVAPDATIMPVRVLGADGSGTMASVAAGIRYAAQMGADIINLSLGGGYSSVIQSALQYAQSLGVLVVAAAGNESASTPSYPARFSATLNNVLSVGAYSSSNTIASFSNDVGSSGAVQVDAPGVGVYSTYMGGGYATLSGTSMATPEVAGLAALALSANHNLTAAQLRSVIVSGANHTISGSDARGGINAALSVALAAAGQVSTSASAAASSAAVSTQTVALRRFFGLSAAAADSAAAALESLGFAESLALSPTAPLAAPAAASVPAAHDQALIAMGYGDDADSNDTLDVADTDPRSCDPLSGDREDVGLVLQLV